MTKQILFAFLSIIAVFSILYILGSYGISNMIVIYYMLFVSITLFFATFIVKRYLPTRIFILGLLISIAAISYSVLKLIS